MGKVQHRIRFVAVIILALGFLGPASAMAQDGVIGVDTGAKDSFAIGSRDEYFRNMDSALTDFARETTRERAARLRADETAARAAAASAGVSCQVSGGARLGRTDDGHDLFEVACDGRPGWLIAMSTPPTTTGCVVANSAAAHALSSNPQGRPPASCTLPANLNVDSAIAGYAREAGIACTVDEVRAIGQVGARAIYEIGCSGRDGYRLTPKDDGGWDKVACLVVVKAGSTCAFTTSAEQRATLHAFLAGTPAQDCVVEDGRYMGASANGTYYEAVCSDTLGYIFRVKDGQTQAFPCAEATAIGGGCVLAPGRRPD